MNNQLRSRITLLSLLSIFFIYKAIMGIIEQNMLDFTLWFLITIIYLISLVILYYVIRNKQNA